MVRRIKLKSKDAAALQVFVARLRRVNIVKDLEAALEQFREIAIDLRAGEFSKKDQ
jgi:hypothetical protein